MPCYCPAPSRHRHLLPGQTIRRSLEPKQIAQCINDDLMILTIRQAGNRNAANDSSAPQGYRKTTANPREIRRRQVIALSDVQLRLGKLAGP